MKVVQLTSSVSRKAGGLFTSVRRLSQSLAALPDTRVDIVGLHDEFTPADAAEWNPLWPQCFPAQGAAGFGFSPALKKHLRSSDCDVVHQHGLWQYISVAASGWHKKTGRPHLISPRGMLDPWALANSRWKKRIAGWVFENANLRGAACLHALCEAEAKAMRAYGLRNPICIIPNGIDVPEVRSQKSEARSQTSGRKTLLYLGRIHPKKGLVNLLKAWAALEKPGVRSQESEWILAIAGWDQGGHLEKLKVLCSALKVESSVCFLGPKFNGEKAACYQSCDAFILPSFSEGLPMVVLEAWSYGKPVLMTPECNLPEGFAAGAAIRIAPRAESIEQGLRELFRAPSSVLRTLGDNGHRLVSERFTWPKIAVEMKSVYEWVLGGEEKPECVQTY